MSSGLSSGWHVLALVSISCVKGSVVLETPASLYSGKLVGKCASKELNPFKAFGDELAVGFRIDSGK